MKTLLVFALLGACVAVSYAGGCYGHYDYECVKDDYKKCKAVKVCEGYKKEKCGHEYCGYGKVCASKKKEVCKDLIKLKEKCEKKKVCKEVKKACGYDYCGYDEECVKEKVCKFKKDHYRRRLMGKGSGSYSDSHAKASVGHPRYHGHGGHGGHGGHSSHYGFKHLKIGKKYGSSYYEHCGYCEKKGKLECYDAYKCEKKEPCKEIVVKKCVKDKYRPGYDVCHGGYHFDWHAGYHHGDKCGDEYCGHGYKCAEVYYQKCEGEKCGHDYCGYGYECVSEDKECHKYAYLEKVCKDVYEPTCVKLGYYATEYYYPKCKTVYKCDKEENICGGKYCGYGYSCAVKECDKKDDKYYYYGHDDKKHDKDYYVYSDYEKEYKDKYYLVEYYEKDHYYHGKDYKDDHYYHGKDYKDDHYYHGKDYKDGHHGYGGKGGYAESSSSSYAGPYDAHTTGHTYTEGDAYAGSHATAKSKHAASKSGGYSAGYDGYTETDSHTKTYADKHGYASGDHYAAAGHHGHHKY